MKACQQGYRVAVATAQEWVSRLEGAQDRNQLEAELRRLERYHLLVVDEVGYLPLERSAANLLFALVSRRYERGSGRRHLDAASSSGARSSATPWWPPPSSTTPP
jgi:DNA replication protein DnaC